MMVLGFPRIKVLKRYPGERNVPITGYSFDFPHFLSSVTKKPGVMVYGNSRDEAISKAEALALRVLADRLEHGEKIPELKEMLAVSA